MLGRGSVHRNRSVDNLESKHGQDDPKDSQQLACFPPQLCDMACCYCHLQGRTLGDREVKAGVTELGFEAPQGICKLSAVRRGVRAPPQQEGSRAVFPFLASARRAPAHRRTQHMPWGTWENEQHPETWLPPRQTERLRIFRKHHTLGVKLRARPPLEKPACH